MTTADFIINDPFVNIFDFAPYSLPIATVSESYFNATTVNINLTLLHQDSSCPRALYDIGAFGTVTCYKNLLLDYQEYDEHFPCPVALQGATDSPSVQPEGEGSLLVKSKTGYIRAH